MMKIMIKDIFLPKRMKIDKCKKLVCNLRNKKNTSYI